MLDRKVKSIDSVAIECEVSLDAESLFDGVNKVASTVKNSFAFIEKALEFNLRDYLDNKLNTRLPKEITRLSNRLEEINVQFLDVKDRVISVTPMYESRMDLKVNLLIDNMNSYIRDTKDLINLYERDLALFITDPDKRAVKYFSKEKYKKIEERQLQLDKEIFSLIDVKGTGVTTLGELIGSINGYKDSVLKLNRLFKSGVNEKDLKVALKEVRDLRVKIEAVVEIVETEDVSKEAIELLITLNTITANQYTLLSKLYHMLFELSQISLNIFQYLKE